MDIRIAIHPSDSRRWRVYLNQFFFDCGSRSAAERIFARACAAERQAAPLPNPPKAGLTGRLARRRVEWV
ncbi:hypothetical protein NK553_27740 [Pseudomonas sp. ZM23]|uniref:Uncharacterized protein n=1 Tax=Pseudomonas triclosanedens TaxID=2961893 RepID=A0ABY7A5D9_9PSED|nr:hypothetical protein [Pseudomonas triclosanedens]MCP8467749.1 hypothetical protein [Pseudomonas triclosanedens]MCP8473716.1 hypothetical protein [Pseudomonas triclosanedens]MCP8479638.1 hypothetical protein [Pseudomonas triclosanedens]WAI51324.1 hypothetical protein OU419_08745 [Pseudomonas triclosanedens]